MLDTRIDRVLHRWWSLGIVSNIGSADCARIGHMNADIADINCPFLELCLNHTHAEEQKQLQVTNTVQHGAKIDIRSGVTANYLKGLIKFSRYSRPCG